MLVHLLLYGILGLGQLRAEDIETELHESIKYKINPAPDGHRCGICPTYFKKICAFDAKSNSTHIFDNHCIMDLYNCMENSVFIPINYEHCIYFGNFAYVHGTKAADMDYEDRHIIIENVKKNPDFIRK